MTDVRPVHDRRAWLEAGQHEVAPGVFRIPLPLPLDGLRAVNVYALVGDDEVVLIDGGWAVEESREQLVRSLRGLGLDDDQPMPESHYTHDHYS